MERALRLLSLTEYGELPGIALSAAERDGLLGLAPALMLRPALGLDGTFDLIADSYVGAVELGSLAIEVRPKVPLDRVMFLMSYAIDPRQWKELQFSFGEQDSVVEAIARGFAGQLQRAIGRGLLQGYITTEDSMLTVRGRIRIDDQIRRWYGRMPPVEVRFDEFTEDIVENRLLKAALRRLGQLRLRSPTTRSLLRHFDPAFAGVTDIAVDPRCVPPVSYTRLNQHYRPAVELARLILRDSSWDLRHGAARASSFFLDMSRVFEEFVHVALREALAESEGELFRVVRSGRLD